MEQAKIEVELGAVSDRLGTGLKLSFTVDNHGDKRYMIYASSRDLRRSGVLLMLSPAEFSQLQEIVAKGIEIGQRGTLNTQVREPVQTAQHVTPSTQVREPVQTQIPEAPKKKSRWFGL